MSLRTMAQRLIDAIGHQPRLGRALDRTVLPLFRRLDGAYRTGDVLRLHREALAEMVPDLTVRHGPFRGLRYPRADAFGSPLFPKLLGCYERELHPMLDEVLGKRYAGIVDVGCAEGYYAVGLARSFPGLEVHAFDIDDRALRFCVEMAELNGVSDRVITGAWCDPEVLRSTVQGSAPWLIVADIEGFERELFPEGSGEALRGHEILVETHDLFDLGVSSTLRQRFAGTHDVRSVRSESDIARALSADYPELRHLDLAARKRLLGERRPEPQEWLYLTPRGSGPAS